MKKLKIFAGLFSAFLCLSLTGCYESEQIPSAIAFYHNLDSARSAAKENKQPLIIEFYKQNCPWSKMYDDSTFTHKLVLAMSEKMMFAKINVDEDSTSAEKYDVSFFPTVVVAGSDGEEIDRLVGYYPPADFFNEIQLYLQGNETLADYLNRLADEPEKIDYHLIIAEKYKHRSDWNNALGYYNNVISFAGNDHGYEMETALIGIADVQCEMGRYPEAIASYQNFIEIYTESDKKENAVRKIPYCLIKLGDFKQAKELFQKYLDDYPHGEYVNWANENIRHLDSVLQEGTQIVR